MNLIEQIFHFISNPGISPTRRVGAIILSIGVVLMLGDLTGYTKFYFIKQKMETAAMVNKMSNDTTFSIESRAYLKAETKRILSENTLFTNLFSTLHKLNTGEIKKHDDHRPKDEHMNPWLLQVFSSGFFFFVAGVLFAIEGVRYAPLSLIKEIYFRIVGFIIFVMIGVFNSFFSYAIFSFFFKDFGTITMASFYLQILIVFVLLIIAKKKKLFKSDTSA